MENTVTTSAISIDRVLAMQSELTSNNNDISTLNRELGAKQELINVLQNQLSELKEDKFEKEPQVKVITVQKKNNSWGDSYNDTQVEYRNLSNVKDDIRKEVETTFKKQLDESEKTIKTLKIQSEIIKDDYDRRNKLIESDYAKYNLDTKLEYNKKRRELEEREAVYNLEISNLNKEIEKIKTNKTDEQIAKQREEEITKLKLRIKDLEKSVKDLTSTNIFIRIWNAIMDKKARVIAQKELLEKQEEISKIKTNDNFGMELYNQMTNWFRF